MRANQANQASQAKKVQRVLGMLFTCVACFAFVASFAVLSGCGGVASTKVVKPSLPDWLKKVSIPIVLNKSYKYGIEADFTDTIIREFQKDGRLTIAGPDTADSVLVATIENYIKEPAQYDVNNVPILYNLKVHVSLKLVKAQTNEVIKSIERVGGFSGGVATFAVSPQTGLEVRTEQEAQREAFEKLSRDIVNLVIFGWEKFN